MITLWGRASSVNVQKPLWLLEELGVPFRREEAGGAFGRTQDAAYLAMNPNATVPTLVMPDGFTLWESHAILRYLARVLPGGQAFYPAGAAAQADIDRWMDWTLASLNDPMRIVFWTLVRTPEAERDMVACARARDAAARLWAILDARLADRAHPCGALSLADMAMGGFLHRWFALPIARPELPALCAWYERLRARPGYAKWVAVELS